MEAERVSYSYGMKLPGPVPYSSIDFHLSFSTDLREGETPKQAMERARKFIQVECEREYDNIRSDKAEV